MECVIYVVYCISICKITTTDNSIIRNILSFRFACFLSIFFSVFLLFLSFLARQKSTTRIMSAIGENGDPYEDCDNTEDVPQKKTAQRREVADLEKVTDYADEKDIISEADLKGAMSIFGDRRNKETAEKIEKENELLRVSIKREDVDLIMREIEISRNAAERTLRIHHGNVVNALIALTN